MPVAADVLTTLHFILQIGFIAVTLMLLLVTAINRLRVRRVRLTWRTGKLFGVPVWPTLFLGAVLLFFGGALVMGQPLPLFLIVGYLLGGIFWFMAGLLSNAVLVTEYGLIRHPNRAEEAVAWGQVVDYFEVTKGRKHRYVFFYLDYADTRRRLELTVPRLQHEAFCRIVREKLDARFELSAQKVYGKKALEG
ncbi:MAG: hypothetical protein ACE5G0_00940 [Rhodothermales bacterium]